MIDFPTFLMSIGCNMQTALRVVIIVGSLGIIAKSANRFSKSNVLRARN